MNNNYIGEQIGHYRVDALLGRGGMGAVYQAYDLRLARPVALKIMHKHMAMEERFKQRFMQEAQTAARLDHPSIVDVHDFGQEDDLLYMVMTLIEGQTLSAYIRTLEEEQKDADFDEILFLLSQVADALGFAHAQGVLHRDVKPDNIMVRKLLRPERAGDLPIRAVVTDFGLAKLLGGGMHTATGIMLGTMNYISPEQCRGEQPGPGSDIYAMGVMLYQLTTGKLPYNISSVNEAIYKHAHELPPLPTELRPNLPPPLEVVINKALAKDPADRYQTPEEMALIMRRIRTVLITGEPTIVGLDYPDILKTGQLDINPPETSIEQPPTTVEQVKRDVEPVRLKMILRPNRLTVSPGGRASTEVNLINEGGTAVSVRLAVEDLPESWINISQDTIHLPAGSQQPVSMFINPPFDSSATAGQHRFWIRAFSSANQQILGDVGGLLQIPTFERFAAELQPNKIKGDGLARLLIRNDSNSVLGFQVGGEDLQNNLVFESLDDHLQQVGAGKVGTMEMRVQARTRPFIGLTKVTPFQILIKGGSVHQQIQGQMEIKPRIPAAILAIVLVFFCISVAVGGFALLNSGLLGTADVSSTEEGIAAVGSMTPTGTPTVVDPAVRATEAQGTVLAITAEAADDNDNDGLANLVEEAIGTDPETADTDDDGLSDGEEINQYNSDPLAPDTDLDGLNDGQEIKIYQTSVNNPDTDGDGLNDGDEVASGSDPLAQPSSTPTLTPSPTNTPTETATPTPTETPTPPNTGAGTGGGLPLGFESFGIWGRGDQANGTITQSGERSYTGGSSAKISYNFATEDNDFVVFLQFNDIGGEPTALNLWVYGDGEGHFLNAWIIDDEGQTWQVPFGRVTHTGWAQMTGLIDTDQDWPWTHISGPDNGEIDYPVRFRGFVLDDVNNAYIGEGEIYLDNLTAVE